MGDLGAALPHRDADVGLLEGRGVVHAVTGHGHDAARPLVQLDEVQLLPRGGAGKEARVEALVSLLVTQRVGRLHVGPVHHRGVVAVHQPHGLSDTARRHGLVAGHHDDLDAGPAAHLDGRLHVVARRVVEAHQGQEREALVRRRAGIVDRLLGEGEDAEALVRHLFVTLAPAGAGLVVELFFSVGRRLVGGGVEDGLRRPLHGHPVRAAVLLVDRRHHLHVRVERLLVHPRLLGLRGPARAPRRPVAGSLGPTSSRRRAASSADSPASGSTPNSSATASLAWAHHDDSVSEGGASVTFSVVLGIFDA